MAKNGMRPVHPGEILREDYLVPLNMSANALATRAAAAASAVFIGGRVTRRCGLCERVHECLT